MSYFLADPDGKLSYSHDWTAWLASSSPADSIASRQWSISPLNGTSPETPTLSGDTTDTVSVSGLQLGKVYRLTERITTDAGNVEDRSILIRCEQR